MLHDGIGAMLVGRRPTLGAPLRLTRDPFTMSVLKRSSARSLRGVLPGVSATSRSCYVAPDEDANQLEARVDRALVHVVGIRQACSARWTGTYSVHDKRGKRFAARPGNSQDNRDVTNLLRTDIRKHRRYPRTSFVYPGRIVAWACQLAVDGAEQATEPLVMSVFTPRSSLDDEGIWS